MVKFDQSSRSNLSRAFLNKNIIFLAFNIPLDDTLSAPRKGENIMVELYHRLQI